MSVNTLATEFLTGADGIIDIRVGSAELDQRKTALFQAKNAAFKKSDLIEQCAKMSIWREAAFVIHYSDAGYSAYSCDDVLLAQGDLKRTRTSAAVPLRAWFRDVFLACRVGHQDLLYDRRARQLYWLRAPRTRHEGYNERWVHVDFRPKHLLHVDVSPPDWRMAEAKEIHDISANRLDYSPEDLFGLDAPFTLKQLKRRRARLLRAYHQDRSQQLTNDAKARLDARVIEINAAFDVLVQKAAVDVPIPKEQRRDEPFGLPDAGRLDEFVRSDRAKARRGTTRKA